MENTPNTQLLEPGSESDFFELIKIRFILILELVRGITKMNDIFRMGVILVIIQSLQN